MVIMSFEHCTFISCICGGCVISLLLNWRFTGFSNSGCRGWLVVWKLVGTISTKPCVCVETSGDDEGCNSAPATGARGCSGVSSEGGCGDTVWLGSADCTKYGFSDGVAAGWYCDEVAGMLNSGWGDGWGGK